MPIISGTLKNATGVRPNTQIILRAIKTTGSVIVNAPDFSIVTDINGRYSFNCNPCIYHVHILQQGFQREDAGIINVYADTKETSLEALLVDLKEGDLTPDVIRQVQAFRNEVVAAKNAAEKAASDAKLTLDSKLDKTATAENSLKLANVAASEYARSNAVVSLTGEQSVSGVKTFTDGVRTRGVFNATARGTFEFMREAGTNDRLYMDYGEEGDDHTFRHEVVINQESDRYGEASFSWHSRTPSDKRILTINGYARTNSDPINGNDLVRKSYIDRLMPFQGTYTAVTANRQAGVNYTNNTGKPIYLIVNAAKPTGSIDSELYVTCNQATVSYSRIESGDTGGVHSISAVIPIGGIYTVTARNITISTWREMS